MSSADLHLFMAGIAPSNTDIFATFFAFLTSFLYLIHHLNI